MRMLWQNLPFYAAENEGGAAEGTDPAAGTAGTEGGTAAGAEGGTVGGTPQQQADWRDKEIKRKHAQLQEERRRNQELETSLRTANEMLQRIGDPSPARGENNGASAAASPAAITPARQPVPAADDNARIQAEAARIVEQQSFERASNDADAAGRERFGEGWSKATETLATLGGFDYETMNNILASDDPAKVLHALGTNPEEYHALMDLPPARRFAKIVKMGLPDPKGTPKRPSGAPAPTEAIGGRNRGDPNTLSDDLDDDTWYARRAAQKKARFESRRAGNA